MILQKLKGAIRKKWLGLLENGVLLLDDNARQNSVTATQNHIVFLGWERLYHSLNLAPSDFHLLPVLKKNLARKRFGSNAEVKQAVKHFFRMQSPEFLLKRFLKLIKQYDRCLNVFVGLRVGIFTFADLVHSPGDGIIFSAAPYRRYQLPQVILTPSFLPRLRHMNSDDAKLYQTDTEGIFYMPHNHTDADAVDFLHHENSPTWAGVRPATLGAEGQ
ncbi:histone-lysine N-methyltransferase SETMAR [Trichonephila clavipes]|nr:histone-lysine N-methyltransferase SETMAR [Trichonephila clavipes]